MAKQTLPTNYKDDVLATSMGKKRRYNLIQNDDGTISLEDATEYVQEGDNYGAAQLNATNQAVNESVDQAKIIDSLDDISANTQPGMVAGALAVAELNGKSTDSIAIKPQTLRMSMKANDVTGVYHTPTIPEGYKVLTVIFINCGSGTNTMATCELQSDGRVYIAMKNWRTTADTITVSYNAVCIRA